MSVTTVFAGHGIGWHYDTAIQYLRLILSGILDRLPNLKLICGHWGELLPYYLYRLDTMFTPEVTGLQHRISEYFQRMYFTPSGMFDYDDFEFCLKKFGSDKLLWATDYPYRKEGNSKDFLLGAELKQEDLDKISHENAEELFNI